MDAADWARLVDTARGGTVVAVVVCRDTNEPCSGRDVDAPMLPDKDMLGSNCVHEKLQLNIPFVVDIFYTVDKR